MTRVAIYARVSTEDQTSENQLHELREYCQRSGFTVAEEYVDHGISGRKGARERPRFATMLADASKRKFDLVLVWALDRLTREGMAAAVGYLQKLACYGISFRSFTESHLSTENELVRDVLLAVVASLAKAEAAKASERTRAGLERAVRAGKRLGRPRALSGEQCAQVAARRAAGASLRAIGRELGVDAATIKAELDRAGGGPGP